jgi:hypothetical protein
LHQSFYLVKEGNKLFFGDQWPDDPTPGEPRLVVQILPDGAIELDPEFVAREKEKARRRQVWASFLERVSLPDGLRRIRRALPGRARTDDDCWAYLEDIAGGRVKVYACGARTIAGLKRFLAAHGRAA